MTGPAHGEEQPHTPAEEGGLTGWKEALQKTTWCPGGCQVIMSHKCALAAKAKCILGCIGTNVSSRSREEILPISKVLMRPL